MQIAQSVTAIRVPAAARLESRCIAEHGLAADLEPRDQCAAHCLGPVARAVAVDLDHLRLDVLGGSDSRGAPSAIIRP